MSDEKEEYLSLKNAEVMVLCADIIDEVHEIIGSIMIQRDPLILMKLGERLDDVERKITKEMTARGARMDGIPNRGYMMAGAVKGLTDKERKALIPVINEKGVKKTPMQYLWTEYVLTLGSHVTTLASFLAIWCVPQYWQVRHYFIHCATSRNEEEYREAMASYLGALRQIPREECPMITNWLASRYGELKLEIEGAEFVLVKEGTIDKLVDGSLTAEEIMAKMKPDEHGLLRYDESSPSEDAPDGLPDWKVE